ncbi:MAG: trypsin-like serine protease, partial [Polyangiales bacterium]
MTKIQGGQPASEVEERSVANLLFLDRAPCNDGEAVLYSCGGARLDLGDPEDVGIYASAAHCAAIYRGGRIEKGWLMRDNAAARTLLPTRSSRCRSAHDVVNFLQEIHQAERAEEAVAFDMQSDVFYPRSYQGIHDNFTKDIALLVTDKPFAEHQALALAGDPKGPMLAVIGVGTTDCHYTWEVARSAESGRSVEGLARRSGSSRYSRGAFVVQGAHVPEHFDITQAVGPLLVSRRMDRAVNPIWGLLEDEMIGIDYDFANTVVCKGDSGSPIVTKARRYVGIMSVVLPYYAAPEVSDVARAWSHYLHNGGDPRAAP